tara:strand:+ start:4609 stop:5160 length:552 start_codon:yes stop_codon:yes gene_type:complete
MQIKLLTSPSDECISLDWAKEYLRVDHDAEDRVISDLIPAAREIIQSQLGYYVGPQKVQVTVPLIKRKGRKITPRTVGHMRGRTCIRLPLSPIISVEKVKVISFEGKEEIVPDGKYHPNLNTYPALIILDYEDKDTAVINLTVGTEEPSKAIKNKILSTLADLYENRLGPLVHKIPLTSGICP